MLLITIILLCAVGSGKFESPITSDQTEVFDEEGANLTLSCSYSTAISLHWYRQYPRSAPENLLLIFQTSGRVQSTENLDSRVSARLNEKKNRVDLIISSVKVTDSALYYCALEPTVTGNLYKMV
uniref:T-cell receptor alpha/delta variable 19.0 n=1 Tax=Cyprinus carpio TaxID=7962 RepID=A0A8C2HKA6_CYPCA